MSHALLYIRKSVVRTGSDTISPERQRELCLIEAERHGWQVDAGDIYIDARGHLSGRTEQRPAWQSLRRRIADDADVGAVIVESLSRASRSVRDFFTFLDQCRARGVALISLKERFDTSGAMGQAMAGVIAIFNQLESDLASERQTDRIAARKADGRHWGLTPFGCDRAPVTGALCPSNATYPLDGTDRLYYAGLNAAYELYATGILSQAALATELNDRGWRYRDRTGEPCLWDAQRVRNVLILNRLYGGEIPLNGHIKDGAPQEWIAGNFAPVLPADLCQRVAATLAVRRLEPRPTPPPLAETPTLAYPLTGLLRCVECGQSMKGAKRSRADGNVDRYYRHRFGHTDCPVHQWTPADGIEAAVGAAMGALLIPPEISGEIAHQVLMAVVSGASEELQGAIEEVEVAIRRVEGEMQRMLRLAMESDVATGTYRPVLVERQRDLDKLRVRRGELALSLDREAAGITRMVARLDQLAQGFVAADGASLRSMAQAVFTKLYVRGSSVARTEVQTWCQPFFRACVQANSPAPVGGTIEPQERALEALVIHRRLLCDASTAS